MYLQRINRSNHEGVEQYSSHNTQQNIQRDLQIVLSTDVFDIKNEGIFSDSRGSCGKLKKKNKSCAKVTNKGMIRITTI